MLAHEVVYFAIGAVALHRFGHRLSWTTLLLRPGAAAAVFASVLWIARPLGLAPSSALASFAFVGATFVLGVWDRRERTLIRDVLARASRRL